ncbi:transcription initiation factor TFIID subunit 7-like [Orycteropus afer afer]|uniref:Transcription initiation factor TFIID subunit 7-like n=1 Tax=Orycteropus afer afer TaxID=1230840 RepID=A0A8B7AS67_ORYAF|nr:transcription initiation factor TFIID subunit 7-like [Orycteropus afer afer]
MEYAKGEAPDSPGKNSTPTVSTSEVPSNQDAQILVAHDTEAACDHGTETASDHGAQIPVDHDSPILGAQIPVDHSTPIPGAQIDVDSSAQAAAPTTGENVLDWNEMSKTQSEPPHELENQFILRLPLEYASTVKKIARSRSITMKDKLKIDLYPDGRHAVVEVEDVSLAATLVDLPCVVGSLKTLDKKTFYKTADISQMLVCTARDVRFPPKEPVTYTDFKVIRKNYRGKKKYSWKHGITPPLKNVRKKRFRKTKKYIDIQQIEEIDFNEVEQGMESSDVEREVKRLLCSDAEAISARWEVIIEDETKEIESQGSISGFEFSSEMSGDKEDHLSLEYDVFRETSTDSSSKSEEEEEEEEEDDKDEDEDDKEEDKDEEEDEEYLERELQARFTELGQYKIKEGTVPIVMEIQKQIYYMEKKLKEIQSKAKRQEELINKVKNLTLKTHLKFILEQLKIQEKQKIEELTSLQEQLKYVLEN